jgi:hypothetical protein
MQKFINGDKFAMIEDTEEKTKTKTTEQNEEIKLDIEKVDVKSQQSWLIERKTKE